MRLFLESYYDLVLIGYLNVYAFFEMEGMHDFFMLFTNISDIVNTLIALVCFVLIHIFPLWVFLRLHRSQDELQDPQVKMNYGIFYEGIKTECYATSIFNIFFMGRRFFIVIILIFFTGSVFFQNFFLILFSALNLAYLVRYKPMETNKENYIEIFNEATILVCSHLNSVFINKGLKLGFQTKMGWLLIVTVSTNMIINISIVIFESAIEIKDILMDKYTSRVQEKMNEARIKNRKHFDKLFPGQFSEVHAT